MQDAIFCKRSSRFQLECGYLCVRLGSRSRSQFTQNAHMKQIHFIRAHNVRDECSTCTNVETHVEHTNKSKDDCIFWWIECKQRQHTMTKSLSHITHLHTMQRVFKRAQRVNMMLMLIRAHICHLIYHVDNKINTKI